MSEGEAFIASWSTAVLEVEVAGGWVHPGVIAEARNCTVHLITAWNPMGEIASVEQNAAADLRLAEQLDAAGIERHRWIGSDRNSPHFEEGWCVLGMGRSEAIALGAHHAQLAIYEVDAESTLIAWCFDDRILDVTQTA